MTRSWWSSSAEAGAGASHNRARAKNAAISGSRHRPIAAQNLSYIADLLMRLSLARSAEAVGLSVIHLTGGQSKGRRHARVVGWPQARARAVGWLVSDEADVGDAEPTAGQDQIDPMAQQGCRVEQVLGLAAGEAGIGRPPALPRVGEPGVDDGLISRERRIDPGVGGYIEI